MSRAAAGDRRRKIERQDGVAGPLRAPGPSTAPPACGVCTKFSGHSCSLPLLPPPQARTSAKSRSGWRCKARAVRESFVPIRHGELRGRRE